MTGFWIGLMFLTRLPTPRLAGQEASDLARAAPWLPVVGALVGALVAAAVGLGALVGPWIGALLGLLVWVRVTGGLHLDGLGDVADGFGAAHGNPERFVEVARDPHLGSFGAIAIGLQIAAKLVLLAAVADRLPLATLVPALVLVAAWARWATLVLGRTLPSLTDGLARRLFAGIGRPIVVAEGAVLGLASLLLAPALLAAVPLALLAVLYWRTRLGAITGDGHGASIEVLESALLFCLLLV